MIIQRILPLTLFWTTPISVNPSFFDLGGQGAPVLFNRWRELKMCAVHPTMCAFSTPLYPAEFSVVEDVVAYAKTPIPPISAYTITMR